MPSARENGLKILETLLVGALRTPLLRRAAEPLLRYAMAAARGAMKRAQPLTVRPRNWSNAELRAVGALYDGRVINVSGWRDEDKAGGHYCDYFPAAAAYAVSNFSGARGVSDGEGEVFLDLEADPPDELVRRFQVAFNHTTLEHVYDIRRAVASICALADDSVILVTPFLQAVHYEEGAFGDYWRPTPMALQRMLKEQGFETIYQSCNDNPWYIVYVFTVASRNPERWRGKLPARSPADRVGTIHFGLA